MRTTVFIGHHKTGTTALQHGMAEAATELLGRGFLYPAVDFQGMAHLAARLAGRSEAVPVNFAEAHNALAFKMIAEAGGGPVPLHHKMLPHSVQMKHAITEQVRRFAPRQLVLVSEVFANFGMIAPQLIDEIASLDGSARIVAVLRRPDDYLVSWHLQRLRFGHRMAPIAEEISLYAGGIHLDYRKMLGEWCQRFSDVLIVPYHQVLAAGGLPSWFGNQIGTALPERQRNVGLHRGFAEIARRAVTDLEPQKGQAVLDWLHRVDIPLPKSSDVEVLGRAARRDIRTAFEPVHDWLCSVTKRKIFFEDLDEIVVLRPISERDLRPSVIEALRAVGGCPEPRWLERLE